MSVPQETQHSPTLDFLRRFPATKTTKRVLLSLGALILSLTAFLLWTLVIPEGWGSMASSVAIAQGMRGPYVNSGLGLLFYTIATTVAALCLWARVFVQIITERQQRRRPISKADGEALRHAAPSDGHPPST